jgi:hypothetical protein
MPLALSSAYRIIRCRKWMSSQNTKYSGFHLSEICLSCSPSLAYGVHTSRVKL